MAILVFTKLTPVLFYASVSIMMKHASATGAIDYIKIYTNRINTFFSVLLLRKLVYWMHECLTWQGMQTG